MQQFLSLMMHLFPQAWLCGDTPRQTTTQTGRRPGLISDTTLSGLLAPAMQFGLTWSTWLSKNYTTHKGNMDTEHTITAQHKHAKNTEK